MLQLFCLLYYEFCTCFLLMEKYLFIYLRAIIYVLIINTSVKRGSNEENVLVLYF